jgi:hypothetical protein
MAATQAIGKDTRRAHEGREPALAEWGRRFPGLKIRAPRQGRGRRLGNSYGPSLEQQWIVRNGAQYKGEWVVLDGDRLVGHGVNAVEIYNRARTQGVISPYLMEIPLEEELPFGGW